MVYTFFKSKVVSGPNGHADTKNTLLRKKLMYFNVYVIGCYFHIFFILIVYCDMKYISRSSHQGIFPKITPKVIYKLFKYRKNLKFKV